MLKNSLFGDGAVGADKPESLGKYEVLRQKYNAQLIDEARSQLEGEWKAAERRHMREALESGTLHPDTMRQRYHVYVNNCQDYIKQVIDRAATLETPNNPLVLR